MPRCIDEIFDDKRICVTLLMFWLGTVFLGCYHIGLLDTHFITFGPSPTTVFMGMKLDTWYEWSLVALFTFVNTIINDFSSDSISPFLTNAIADHKSKYLPYSKLTCLYITQMWTVYCNLMSVFGLFLSMTQIDFVIILMVADLMVNFYSNMRFVRYKIHCPVMYQKTVTENPLTHPEMVELQQMEPDRLAQLRRKQNTMKGVISHPHTTLDTHRSEFYCITEDQVETGGEAAP